MQKALAGQSYRFYGLHYRKVKNDKAKDWLMLKSWQLEEAAEHDSAFSKALLERYPDFAQRCMTTPYVM